MKLSVHLNMVWFGFEGVSLNYAVAFKYINENDRALSSYQYVHILLFSA
jgi:hypothetical protein